MILKVDGDINEFYVQTLCMVFFPGATFAQAEEPGVDVPEVFVKICEGEGGSTDAYVRIKLNDRVCEAKSSVLPDENILISTPGAIAVGRALFSAGKELLRHTPPWGILTGVRPAKVAVSLLEGGKGILKSKKLSPKATWFTRPRITFTTRLSRKPKPCGKST